jgi:PAS domain S-box-containing protein
MARTPPTDDGDDSRRIVPADMPDLLPEEDFTEIFDRGADLVCVRDMAGRFVGLSPSWTTTLGFTLEDLQGAPLLSLIHPDDVWATHDVMQGISATNPVVGFTNRYRCKDGSYRRLEWTARLYGDRVLGVARVVPEK